MKSLIIIWATVIVMACASFAYFDWATMPAHADAGDTTACPAPEYLQGYDKDTGAPVCSNPPTGCPYGDQIPVDSPKCAAPPDPNRPYYDLWGNEFDYQGNLIQAAPCTTDPISGEANPYSCSQAVINSAPAEQSIINNVPDGK